MHLPVASSKQKQLEQRHLHSPASSTSSSPSLSPSSLLYLSCAALCFRRIRLTACFTAQLPLRPLLPLPLFHLHVYSCNCLSDIHVYPHCTLLQCNVVRFVYYDCLSPPSCTQLLLTPLLPPFPHTACTLFIHLVQICSRQRRFWHCTVESVCVCVLNQCSKQESRFYVRCICSPAVCLSCLYYFTVLLITKQRFYVLKSISVLSTLLIPRKIKYEVHLLFLQLETLVLDNFISNQNFMLL